jgi:hypothetical protein
MLSRNKALVFLYAQRLCDDHGHQYPCVEHTKYRTSLVYEKDLLGPVVWGACVGSDQTVWTLEFRAHLIAAERKPFVFFGMAEGGTECTKTRKPRGKRRREDLWQVPGEYEDANTGHVSSTAVP